LLTPANGNRRRGFAHTPILADHSTVPGTNLREQSGKRLQHKAETMSCVLYPVPVPVNCQLSMHTDSTLPILIFEHELISRGNVIQRKCRENRSTNHRWIACVIRRFPREWVPCRRVLNDSWLCSARAPQRSRNV